MIPYADLLERFRAQLRIQGHLVGVVAGAGLIGSYAMMGGADFLLALSSGRYRIMGRGSYAGYYCYGSSNEITMELGTRELLPILPNAPILFGLAASDPFIHLYEYLKEIKSRGFAGVTNFPTIALIDGQFRRALEEDGNVYEREVEALALAHHLGLFTVAFVTCEEEASAMLRVGVDVICVHLGLTKGGFMGAKKYISLAEATQICDRISTASLQNRPFCEPSVPLSRQVWICLPNALQQRCVHRMPLILSRSMCMSTTGGRSDCATSQSYFTYRPPT